MPVEFVHKEALREGPQTGGMIRKEAFARDNVWIGEVHTSPGMISGWHQHGDHNTYVYVVTGKARLESGADGLDVLEAEAGDFGVIPAHTIHREGNPGNVESIVVVVRIGTGPTVFNVDGPGKG